MKLTFRWFGPDDPVTPAQIRQIPTVTGIVSAVYDTPPGGVWSEESIRAVHDAAAENGLTFEVVESVPVPEDIKLGTARAADMLDAYAENLRRLGRAGVRCVCYNFMPVFDWLRSELHRPQADGANALAYDHETVLRMDPLSGDLSLPGWDQSYGQAELKSLLSAYATLGEDGLRRSLHTFLEAVIPAARAAGIRMAIHPDDPPWGMFGLPRIVSNADDLRRLLSMADDEANGITFCTGSLGADPRNDLPVMAAEFADRIPFAHLRNIRRTGVRRFEEVGHPTACGSLDLYGVARALVTHGFDGYVRPDHGRMIWGEDGRCGYGLFDRALGATYLAGLFEALEKEFCHHG